MFFKHNFRQSNLAKWGLRLSIFAACLIIITILLHRFAAQSSAVALNLIKIGFFTAAIALSLSLIAAMITWNNHIAGFGRAVVASVLSLSLLAWPISQLPKFLWQPAVYDISTDLTAPPQFNAIAKQRQFGANKTHFQIHQGQMAQEKLFPDIRPLIAQKSTEESFDLIRETIAKKGWEIIAETPPIIGQEDGIIEAIERSYLVSLPDDIIIRITGGKTRSRIDIRSASRYGHHDLGRNIKRIRNLTHDIITHHKGIDLIEIDPDRALKQATDIFYRQLPTKNETTPSSAGSQKTISQSQDLLSTSALSSTNTLSKKIQSQQNNQPTLKQADKPLPTQSRHKKQSRPARPNAQDGRARKDTQQGEAVPSIWDIIAGQFQ